MIRPWQLSHDSTVTRHAVAGGRRWAFMAFPSIAPNRQSSNRKMGWGWRWAAELVQRPYSKLLIAPLKARRNGAIPPSPFPLEGGEGFFGWFTQGGGRCATLPWAINRSPRWGWRNAALRAGN
jgi:hypothetical protein